MVDFIRIGFLVLQEEEVRIKSQKIKSSCSKRDSNSRPLDFEATAVRLRDLIQINKINKYSLFKEGGSISRRLFLLEAF